MIDDLSLEIACTPPSNPTNTTLSLETCPGTSATLTASGSGTLGWYADSNATTYLGGGTSFTTGSLTSDTTFYVQDSTCSAGPLLPILIPINQPVNYSQNISLCPNEQITVGTSVYNAAGTYTDVLTASSGCDSTVTTTISVTPIDVSVIENGTSLTANASGGSYQWVDCGNNLTPISGATNQSFIATVDGSYAVIVTANNCSDTSACFTVSTTGMKEQNLFDWVISPNPTHSSVTVESTETVNSIELFSIDGTLLKVLNTPQVSVIDYPAGIYLLRIKTDKGIRTARFIKE
jgi:hypothetical protein